MSYSEFARVYDYLMDDVDYKSWIKYINDIFRDFAVCPSSLVDLGCGTGTVSVEFALQGMDVIGIDQSVEMLSVAKNKALKNGVEVLFLQQDMTDFELYGTVDAMVSLMDSINHITDKNRVLRMFKWVRNYLNPGGVFVFDINTPYKLKSVLGNNVFYDIGDECSYLWQCNYQAKKKLNEFELTFFVKDEDDKYNKMEESFFERAYSIEEIKELVKKAGMKTLAVYDELSKSMPTSKSERVFFIVQK